MFKKLTEPDIRSYRENGILFPLPVLSPAEAAFYRSQFEELETRLGGRPKAVQLSRTHLYFQWARDLCTCGSVLDAVEDLLGPDLMVWSTSIFPKYPHDPSYISWHQDGTYWALDSSQVTTAWIALTDSTVENGCMRVVPGTHRNRILPHRETYAEGNLLSRGQEIAVEVDESEAVDVVLKAGEMSLHDVNIIHGSNANGSDGKRIGFAIRFITPQVNQLAEKEPALLVRGEDRYGHFPAPDSPPTADLEAALADHREGARRFLEKNRTTKGAF